MAPVKKKQKFDPTWVEEKNALKKNPAAQIIGLDEVGRGCVAGPVVAAAAMIPSAWLCELGWPLDGSRPKKLSKEFDWLLELNDSKKIPETKRKELVHKIESSPIRSAWSFATAQEIDQINILQASFLAMKRGAEKLTAVDEEKKEFFYLVDGNQVPPFCKGICQTIVQGDSKSLSIACASLVAKVARDDWMEKYDEEYFGYGLKNHKGYPTPKHWAAIRKLGPSPIHRLTFNGVVENSVNVRLSSD